MNSNQFQALPFGPLIERLRALGVDASLPDKGESYTSAEYQASLFGWMLDALERRGGKSFVPAVALNLDAAERVMDHYIQMPATAFAEPKPFINRNALTAKSHITEGGRSYNIEGVVQGGKTYKPGEPLPPLGGDDE